MSLNHFDPKIKLLALQMLNKKAVKRPTINECLNVFMKCAEIDKSFNIYRNNGSETL